MKKIQLQPIMMPTPTTVYEGLVAEIKIDTSLPVRISSRLSLHQRQGRDPKRTARRLGRRIEELELSLGRVLSLIAEDGVPPDISFMLESHRSEKGDQIPTLRVQLERKNVVARLGSIRVPLNTNKKVSKNKRGKSDGNDWRREWRRALRRARRARRISAGLSEALHPKHHASLEYIKGEWQASFSGGHLIDVETMSASSRLEHDMLLNLLPDDVWGNGTRREPIYARGDAVKIISRAFELADIEWSLEMVGAPGHKDKFGLCICIAPDRCLLMERVGDGSDGADWLQYDRHDGSPPPRTWEQLVSALDELGPLYRRNGLPSPHAREQRKCINEIILRRGIELKPYGKNNLPDCYELSLEGFAVTIFFVPQEFDGVFDAYCPDLTLRPLPVDPAEREAWQQHTESLLDGLMKRVEAARDLRQRQAAGVLLAEGEPLPTQERIAQRALLLNAWDEVLEEYGWSQEWSPRTPSDK